MDTGKKIVIVEDDVASASEMKKFLETKGYAVSFVSDSSQALGMIKETGPDLVLLDIIMPGLDGFTVAKQIRYDEQTKGMPIIVFSAQEGMRELFAIEGINEYLVKPVDREQLFEIIRKKLGQ
ncbi:MAG: response regulator [Candidatus Omnitrophica bacterium]|nr:response regulator [Candidatus Omnitrophota bacterium]